MSAEEILLDTEERMEKAVAVLKQALAGIRTGRANPGLIDSLRVEVYGSQTPIKSLASIGAPEPQQIVVRPFDPTTIKDIEKAIISSGLGFNPTNLGELLLISMPALTEETRRGFTKQARDAAEDSRVAVRNIRRDALSQLKDLAKEKEISEDDERRAADEVQKLTDKYVAEIDAAVKQKEADLMAV